MALASITDVSWEEDDEGTVYPDSFTTYFDYAGSLDSVYGYWAEAWYEDGVFIEDTGEELTVIRDDGFPLYYRDGGMIQEDGEIVEWWNFEETTRSYDNVLEIIGVESNSEWEGLDTMYVDRLIYESDDSLRYVLVDDDYPFEFLLVNSGNNLVATVEEADGVDFMLIWYNTSFQELFSNSGDQAVIDFSDGLLYENGDTLFTTIERSEPTSYGFLTTTLRLTDEAFEAGTSAPEDYYVDGLLHTYVKDGIVDSTKAEWMCFDEEGPTGEFCDGDSVYFTYASFNIATHNETQHAGRLGSGEVIGYPNPSASKVVFEVTNTPAPWHGLEVYDLLGKRVLSLRDEEVEMSSTTITIDVGTLASGVYFLRIGSEEGVHTGRFVVLR